MAIKTQEVFNPSELFATEYFAYVNVDGREFLITTKPMRRGQNTCLLTPFSDEAERQIFINFATEFYGLASQSSPLGKMEQRPQGILQWIWRLLRYPLFESKRLCRSFLRGHHDQDMSGGLPEKSARPAKRLINPPEIDQRSAQNLEVTRTDKSFHSRKHNRSRICRIVLKGLHDLLAFCNIEFRHLDLSV